MAFEDRIIVLQAPAKFPKNQDVSNTTGHETQFWL